MSSLAKIVGIGMVRDIRREGDKLVTGPGGIQGYLTIKVGKDVRKVWVSPDVVTEIGKAISSAMSDSSSR